MQCYKNQRYQHHCVKRYTVRNPFRVDCEKIPLSRFFYTNATTDASDKYQVCTDESDGDNQTAQYSYKQLTLRAYRHQCIWRGIHCTMGFHITFKEMEQFFSSN